MPSTYLPTREIGLRNWLENFSTKVSAAPAAYGLSPLDAETIAAAVETFSAALTVALAPGTRTRPAVQAKNDAKAAALLVVRRFAARIRASDAVASVLKIELGLHVPATKLDGTAVQGSPIPAPASRPVLNVVEIERGAHALRISTLGPDGEVPRRARPRTAMGLVLFRTIADGPVRDPSSATFLALVTRPVHRAAFDHADNGKTATYFARWANLKGELGPWSTPTSTPIAA